MKLKLLLIFTFLLLVPFATSANYGIGIEQILENPEAVFLHAKKLNPELTNQGIPSYLKRFANNEIINFEVLRNDQSKTNFRIYIRNGKLINLKNGLADDGTILVKTSETTLTKITNSQNPVKDFRNAINNDAFDITGLSMGNKIKIYIGRVALKFA